MTRTKLVVDENDMRTPSERIADLEAAVEALRAELAALRALVQSNP